MSKSKNRYLNKSLKTNTQRFIPLIDIDMDELDGWFEKMIDAQV